MTLTVAFGDTSTSGTTLDPDEALSTRLRDLALVDLDALGAGNHALIGAFADDVAHALGETRTRITALRGLLGGLEPLNVLDLTIRQRASDSATVGASRSRDRLTGQAEAARSLARLADLSGPLVPKLFEADRRR